MPLSVNFLKLLEKRSALAGIEADKDLHIA